MVTIDVSLAIEKEKGEMQATTNFRLLVMENGKA